MTAAFSLFLTEFFRRFDQRCIHLWAANVPAAVGWFLLQPVLDMTNSTCKGQQLDCAGLMLCMCIALDSGHDCQSLPVA